LCSVSGAPCLKSVGCEPVQISGFCVDRDDVSGYASCAYDARFDGNGKVVCEGEQADKCLNSFDCPGEAFCNSLHTNWCGSTGLVEGLCTWGSGGLSCVTDDDCTVTPTNECLACGDGTLDAPQEACDDGNTFDNDLCSSRCQPAGFCFTESHVQLSARCSKPADCETEAACAENCTCEPAP
jgi:cysteine-rich repeat protein